MSAAVAARDDAATDDEEDAPPAAALDPVAAQAALVALLDANDFDAFAARLAPDAAIRNLAGEGAGAAGRDKVMAQVKAIGGKLKGRLGDVAAAPRGERGARAVATVKAFGMTIRVFFEFEFSTDGTVVAVGLGKDVGDAAAFLAPPTTEAGGDDGAPAPPFRVPRPAAFPGATVEVRGLRIVGELASPYKIKLRPLNPYVRLGLRGESPGASAVRSRAKHKDRSPDFGDEQLLLRVADTARETLEFTIMDKNHVGRNQWLARGALALADVAPCENPTTVELPLETRLDVLSQAAAPADAPGAPRLALELQVFDCERWWRAAETAARDAAEEAAAPSKRWFRTFF